MTEKKYHFVTSVRFNNKIYTKDIIEEKEYFIRLWNNFRVFNQYIEYQLSTYQDYEKLQDAFFYYQHKREIQKLLTYPFLDEENRILKDGFYLELTDIRQYLDEIRKDLKKIYSEKQKPKNKEFVNFYYIHIYLFDCVIELFSSIRRMFYIEHRGAE